jgi:hypothetical protein
MSIDLRELMRERVAVSGPASAVDRLGAVHRRIRQARRRRAAAAVAGACALVVAIVVGAWNVPMGHENSAPQPAVTPTTIDGFDEYSQGGRVIATAIGHLPQTQASVTVTPPSLDLKLQTRCEPGMWAEVAVNGRHLFGSDCDNPGTAWWEDATALGVEPGQPVTFTITVTHVNSYAESGRTEQPLPGTGTFALAVLQRVAFDAYPLPTPPATLASLRPGWDPVEVLARSDPADPLRPVSVTFTWVPEKEFRVSAQTPGYLHLAIDGVEVLRYESWDYQATVHLATLDGLDEVDVAAGTPVTLTVTPEHVTGDWIVWLVG